MFIYVVKICGEQQLASNPSAAAFLALDPSRDPDKKVIVTRYMPDGSEIRTERIVTQKYLARMIRCGTKKLKTGRIVDIGDWKKPDSLISISRVVVTK